MDIVEKKRYIASMKEEEFRIELLIPLFYKMGFQEVMDYHGGSLEKGKDIIFWKNDEFHIRQNYGVIVKPGDISGSVSDHGKGMPTFFIQIQQALSSNFISNADGREYEITRIVLATNGRITKEAMESICGQLKTSNMNKILTFLHIENILGFIDEYLPKFFEKDQSPYSNLAYQALDGFNKIKLAYPSIEFPPETERVIKVLAASTGAGISVTGLNPSLTYISNVSGDQLPPEDMIKHLP